ncbi:hypothetical protein T11_17369 [Trichinella zimbabwensis]|uniref:Uncharacterized protein n=1 Tax=Trichinella zimbabwensis TaxID=268475 RepID=A0A0V1GJ98_9BILA|nr:hypothetical protein T11_17369 [Trichinella zimbabwensis]
METLTGFECHQFIQAFSWATCRHEDASCRFIAFRK